jgi:hypothetical protein
LRDTYCRSSINTYTKVYFTHHPKKKCLKKSCINDEAGERASEEMWLAYFYLKHNEEQKNETRARTKEGKEEFN